MTLFGRHSEERAADEQAADERAEARAEDQPLADRTLSERKRIPTNRGVATVERSKTEEPETVPVRTAAPTVAERGWQGRTSGLAVFGLIFGLTAVYAALSGRLVPVALVAAVLGVLCSGGGLSATSRSGVTGRSVALFGLLLSIVGGIFAVLAMTGMVSWLNGDVDQVARARDWLNSQFSWLRRW